MTRFDLASFGAQSLTAAWRTAVAPMLSAVICSGCPQMLDDQFNVRPASASANSPGGQAGITSASNGGQASTMAGRPLMEENGRAGTGGSNAGRGGMNTSGLGGTAGATTPALGASDASTAGGSNSPPGDASLDAEGPNDSGALSDLEVLQRALVHRYDFAGLGTVATDRVGSAHGQVVGSTLDGSGRVTLGPGLYADLPNGLISARQGQTVEGWVTWAGGTTLQRIFDFGSPEEGEGVQGTGGTYFFFGPVGNTGELRGAVTLDGLNGIEWMYANSALVPTTLTQVTVVVDEAAEQMRLYVDGEPDSTFSISTRVSSLVDVNNWLGRPQVSVHDHFNGTMEEFRLYDRPLTDAQVLLSQQLGPNTAELP